MCFIEYFLQLFQQTKEDKMPQPNRVKQVELIQKHEALRLEAYMPTPHDKPTIGWGHTSTTKMGMKITMEQALALFRMDLTWVRKVIKGPADTTAVRRLGQLYLQLRWCQLQVVHDAQAPQCLRLRRGCE